MAFVHLGGDDSTKPTYFEVLAADKLVPSLRAALVYALSVFSQRHPWLHRVLDHEDEVLALAMLLADWHSLHTSDATFAESLYGLRRRRIGSAPAPTAVGASQQQPQQQQAAPRLTSQQRWLSLLVEVGVPYVGAKAERTYRHAASGGTAQRPGLFGLAAQRGLARLAASPLLSSSWAWRAGSEWAPRVRHAVAKCVVASYPAVRTASEVACLAYQVAYLLHAAPCHRPLLHAQRLQLARVSAHDLAASKQHRDAWRRAALVGAQLRPGRPRWFASLHQLLLRAGFLASDHAHHGLMLLVFGFKALEWWFTSAEERLAAGKALAPPAPPPPPRPAPQGVGLPEDPSCCAVCRQEISNPAQVATSGYVFCYRCVHQYVSEHRCCPVTLVPCGLEHVRKLYDAV